MQQKGILLHNPSDIEFLCWLNFLDQLKFGKGVMGFTYVFTTYAVSTMYFVYILVWAAALEAGRALTGRRRREQGRGEDSR